MIKLEVIGRPTKDLELKMTKNGKEYINFSVACSEFNGKEYEATFINCVVYGNNAKEMFNFLKPKGRVYLSGILRNNDYETQNGTKVYSLSFLVSRIEILDFKEKEEKLETVEDFNFNYNPFEE